MTASGRAREITQRLLAFASGGVPVTAAESVSQIVRETADFTLAGSNVRCEMRLDENVPFVEIDKGQILLDGVPIERMALDDLRGRIGLVLQDVFLFSQDVGYNIRLGSPQISDEAVRSAAERIGAAPFIDRLADGYDQALGERGSTLSVGERQLVSFARALAFDPEILVLDEATSSVDSELEEQIEAATDELLKNRTSLVIAHRLSTVHNADRILVLHHGELCEEGTHAELLEAEGLYAQLHELQFAAAVG